MGFGGGSRLSSFAETSAIVWLVRHVAWLMTRYNTGRDGCSPFRRIFSKPYDGSICKFGEQIHYKLSGRPSSRVEPRWELGAWVGKMELTDEHLLGTIRSRRTIYRLPKSHRYNKDALDRIEGTPTNLEVRRCGQGKSFQVHHAEMDRRARCHSWLSLKRAGRDSTQSRRRSSTKSWERPRGMRNRHL